MSDKKEKPKTKAATRPQTRPKPTPKAVVPPRVGPVFSRPMGASPTQRRKRASARGSEPSGSITAKVLEPGEGELMLYGAIGADFWGEGITAVGFNDALNSLGNVSTIHLRINSGGGDVFEATSIYNMLVKHGAEIIVEIEGVAASAATLISMSGDEIRISENAHFMIHAASGIAWGNADQLRQYLKLLDNADELIRLTYSRRTGISANKLVAMMDHDNWMTAQEALDLGFVDVLDEAKSVEPVVEPDKPMNLAKQPVTMTDERLAAMVASLESLAASAGIDPQEFTPRQLTSIAASVTKPTGSSPLTVPPVTKKEPEEMNAKLRAKCLAAGMAETLTGADADKWLDDNFEKVMATEPKPAVPAVPGNNGSLTADEILNLFDARDKKKAEARKTWTKEVDANIALAFSADPPAELVAACYELQDDGIEAVRTKIQEAKKAADEATSTGGVRINFSASQPRDRHIAAIRAGVMVRALGNFAPLSTRLEKVNGKWERVEITAAEVLEKHLPAATRPKDWEVFAGMSLINIAEECLLVDGLTHDHIRRMPPTQVAMMAMGYGDRSVLRAAAIHTTGSLLEVTRDAVNKSLIAGYEEAPQTWRGPMRQGASVADFKEIHRVKLGAAGNLPVWTDNTAPEQAKLSNEKESYGVEARAETLSFSWRLLVNDDLDALSRRPQLLGDAAGRTVNSVAWQQVTSNPTMADAQALFLETPTGLRFRKNLTTGSATPTNTTIGAMKALMRLMRGLNTPEGAESQDILNLTPTYIVAPASLEEIVLKQVFSGADPAASGNSAVFNTSRTLQPIIEPLLDAASTTAWYLFASPNRVDTIEVTFLQGQETPYAHEWMDDETMCQNYTIMQTFGAKAIDFRGVQRHDGA